MKLTNNLTFKHTLDMLETQYDYKYDPEQKYQLEVGFERGVDIHKYANPDFDWIYMSHLRRALEHGSDISRYVKPTYVPQLLKVISDLAVFNVDIEEFVSDNQLDIGGILDLHSHLLRSKNIDPLDDILQEALCALGPYYVNEYRRLYQMKLKNNLTFESFTQAYKDQYNHEQLWWLRKGYDEGLDISLYANPAFNSNQMFQIMYGLENNVDASKYAFVEYNHVIMSVIYHLLKNGAHFNKYIIEDHLDVDKLMSDYELLIRYKGFSRLDKWAIDIIYDGAPYYVKQ